MIYLIITTFTLGRNTMTSMSSDSIETKSSELEKEQVGEKMAFSCNKYEQIYLFIYFRYLLCGSNRQEPSAYRSI